MSLDGLTLEKLKARKKELESQASFLEDKFREVLLRSPSQRPCPLTLKEYVERAFRRNQEGESTNPFPYKNRDEILRAFSQEDVSFTIDFLKPYLINRQELNETDKQLQRIARGGVPTESSGKDEPFVFQIQDKVCRIVYRKRKFPQVKANLGFKYIAELLSGKTFYAPEELDTVVNGTLVASPSSRVYSEMDSEQLREEEGLYFQGESSGQVQEKMDKTCMKQCQEELQFIQKELEKAERNNDPSQIEIFGEKKNQLLDLLGKDLNLFGRSRSWSGKTLKLKDSISKSIHRAINKIEEIEKSEGWGSEVSKHLRGSLTPVSFPYSYSPEQPITWQT